MTLLLLKVTLVFALGLVLLSVLRRASAAARHLVIVTALATSLLLPVLLLIVPGWGVLPVPELGLSKLSTSSPKTVDDRRSPAAFAPAPQSAAAPAPPVSLPRDESLVGDGWALLPAVWAGGGVAMLLLLAWRLAVVQRTVRRSQPVVDPQWLGIVQELAEGLRIAQPVSVRRRRAGGMPMIWGFRRPVVLLPEEATGWPPERLRAVLAHELGHVARGDLLAILLAHLTCAVYWFHPLAWLLGRRLAVERELACDDVALGQGIEPRRYATHLLDIAAACGRASSLAPVMAAPSQLEGRIMAILDHSRRNSTSRFTRIAILTTGLALTLLLTSLTWADAVNPAGLQPIGATVSQVSDSDDFAAELRRLAIDPDDVARLLAALRSERELTRAAAAWALGGTGAPTAVEPLIEALEDRSPKVREWAARSLGELGDRRAVEPLRDRLDDDDDAEVRQWAARSLADLGDRRAVGSLIAALDDSDAESRQWAARGLADLGDPSAVEPLIDHLVDSDAEVRQWVVRALGELGDERSIPALTALVDDPDSEVAEWAARALGDLGGDERQWSWDWDPKDEEPLMPALDWGPPRAGDALAIAALVKSLESGDAAVREWSARSLGEMGDASAVAPLASLIRDEEADVREWAIRSLGSLRDPSAVAPLLEALADESPNVREWAVRSLGVLPDARTFDPLLGRLLDPSPEVREWAVRAVGATGDPRALEPLASLTNDPNPEVRRWAERAIEYIQSG